MADTQDEELELIDDYLSNVFLYCDINMIIFNYFVDVRNEQREYVDICRDQVSECVNLGYHECIQLLQDLLNGSLKELAISTTIH